MNRGWNDGDCETPDVTEYDVWADPQCLHEAKPWILPPRRLNETNPDGNAENEQGLRIGGGLQQYSGSHESAPSKLQVSEISGDVPRLAPEKPSVERLQGVYTFQKRSKDEGHRKINVEAQDWGHSAKASKQSILWFAGSGLVVCSVVIAAMMLSPIINRSNAMNSRPGQAQLVVAEDTSEQAKPITEMLAKEAQAKKLFQTWLTASSKEEVAHVLKDPQEVLPLLNDDSLPRLPVDKALPSSGITWNAFEKDSLIYAILEGEQRDFTLFTAYFVIVDGSLRLDWKATTGYGSESFDVLSRGQGTASEIRGWLKPSDFYTLVFPEAEFQSYQFSSPDMDSSIWVYSRRNTQDCETILTSFKGGNIIRGTNKAMKITLRLEEAPEEAAANQWIIAELLHKDWIEP